MEFIRGTTLVHLKIRCWSGEKKASRESDIQLGQGGAIPPKNLLNLGRKKIFPPRALDPLIRQRKSAERACLGQGTRFMSGYAVPDEAVDGLIDTLNKLKDAFQVSMASFMSNFETNKTQWLDENQAFAHVLRGQVPDRSAVENAFEFSFKLYKLEPLAGFEVDEDAVANQILHEVGMTCKELSNRMLDRKTAIGGKTLKKQLVPLINKLDTLSFGNAKILTVLDEFRLLKASIPEERLDNNHSNFGHTVTFLSMCAGADKLERIINGQFSVAQLLNANKPQIQRLDASSPFTQPHAPVLPSATLSAYF